MLDKPKLVECSKSPTSHVVRGEVELHDLMGREDPMFVKVEEDSYVPFLNAMGDREDGGFPRPGAQRNAAGAMFRGLHLTTLRAA